MGVYTEEGGTLYTVWEIMYWEGGDLYPANNFINENLL